MVMVACATCSHPVPAGARFCPSCGTALVKADVALEERRVVTVLFADLVGYTSLAEHLDPERVKRLVESCFERLVADIEQFGGRVDKLLGDAIVALFGAPVAHEDDAERAVRAGLRMHDTLARFVEERGADQLQMRVGINTGEVLVGILAGSDYTAMGDVVNTASRLQALAPPGGAAPPSGRWGSASTPGGCWWGPSRARTTGRWAPSPTRPRASRRSRRRAACSPAPPPSPGPPRRSPPSRSASPACAGASR